MCKNTADPVMFTLISQLNPAFGLDISVKTQIFVGCIPSTALKPSNVRVVIAGLCEVSTAGILVVHTCVLTH